MPLMWALPRRGIVAGCGVATTAVKIYVTPPLEQTQGRMAQEYGKKAELKVYLDDYTLQERGSTDSAVLKNITRKAHNYTP